MSINPLGNPPRYYFKWGLFNNNLQNHIQEYFSRVWAFNLGPRVVEGFGWTSDGLAYGRDSLDWIGTGPNATKALAGGAKKIILATPFYSHITPVFDKTKTFRMLSIRIQNAPDAATILLLNFSDIEVLDHSIADFSKMPKDETGYHPMASFHSVFVKVHDPTVDVFSGVEFSGPLDHSKQKAEAARTLRVMEALENLNNSLAR